jgi:DNA-binding transcriptional LysR family regulator
VKNFLVVPASHRLADKENLSLKDFKDDVFIVNSPEDTRAGFNNMVEECIKNGFTPKYKAAATLDEYMLWLEFGYGVTVLSEHNILKLNPQLKFISVPEVSGASIVISWLRDNPNPSAKSFIKAVDLVIEKTAKAKP